MYSLIKGRIVGVVGDDPKYQDVPDRGTKENQEQRTKRNDTQLNTGGLLPNHFGAGDFRYLTLN